MNTREDLPRISVGTVQDWQWLKANYTQTTLALLEEKMTSSGCSNERDVLLSHLHLFIDQTFALAQTNLRINGHNFEALDASGRNMEPFDEALDRRIWSLADTRLQWHRRIAERRRRVPLEIEASVSDILSQRRQADEKVLASMISDRGLIEDEYVAEDFTLPVEELQDSFQKASAVADELEQMLPAQQERAGRVKTSSLDVKALKP
ncbi:hypothetical protein BDQ17DRAFT_1357904 [Cyathus striatus]|nr:hypothetical protein BDQ17DRAFT_1357904 [Cyathus striatus]